MSNAEREKWDRYYASLEMGEEDDAIKRFNAEFVRCVLELLPENSTILEAGCGAGWQSLALARTGKFRVSLMDFSPRALGYAKRLFEREGMPHVDFISGDVLSPGTEEFDLVFNAGVLEHYSFDKQVAFVRGMASRSRKYVLALLPNRLCYWYWLWRVQEAGAGRWHYGKEVPLTDLAAIFEAADLHFLGQNFMGEAWTEAFVSGLSSMSDDLRETIIHIHRSPLLPRSQKSYLIAALGSVSEESPAISPDWVKPLSRDDGSQIAELIAAVSDALVIKIDSEARVTELKQRLEEKNRAIQELQTLLQERLNQITSFREEIYKRDRALEVLKGELTAEKVINYSRQLRKILREHRDTKGIIIYLPTIDWGSLFQRPQQMALALARQEYLFIYCTPNSSDIQGFKKIRQNLILANVPFEVLRIIHEPVIYLNWAVNRNLLDEFSRYRLIYDYIDELEIFHLYGDKMVEDHEFLVQHADVVVATSDNLLRDLRRLRSDAIIVPNAVDYPVFAAAAKGLPAPPDLEPIIYTGRPVIGYYGALAEWLDYGLLRYLSREHPDYAYVLIGPDYDGSIVREAIYELPNVFWLGPKKYDDLPSYLANFSVATIPFRINKITLSTSPIKLFEYMAAGCPVVTTVLPECRKYRGVMVADSYEEFASLLARALAIRNDPNYINLLQEEALANTWDARARAIIKVLDLVDAHPPGQG